MFRKIVVFLFMLPVCFMVQGMNERPWVVIVNEKDDVIYFNENHYSNNSLDLEKSIEELYPNGFYLKNTNRDAVGMVIADETIKFEENSVEEIFFEIKPTVDHSVGAAFASKNLNLIFTMCSILGLSFGMWYGSARKTYCGT
jgi:hypothetical protein